MVTAAQKAAIRKAQDEPMPHSTEAESGVISSVLLDSRMLDDVLLVVTAADFFSEDHRRIFELIVELHNANKPFDFLILAEKLRAIKDATERERMLGVLSDVSETVPTAAHAVWYAKIVRTASIKREIVSTGFHMLRKGQDAEDADELLAEAESMIFALSEKRTGLDAATMGDVLFAAMEGLATRSKGVPAGVRTGIASLDQRHNGMRPGELVILAARPSMGKTALAVCIARNAAMQYGKSVLFVSLEMSRLEIGERILCGHGRIDFQRFRNGCLHRAESRQAIESQSELSAAKICVDDHATRTVSEIGAMARRQKRRMGLDLLVIDYLQLVRPDNTKDQRQEQVAKIGRSLKGLARELNVPVLCLSQLNRESEKSGDNKPKLHHLRESGAIEQDADVVWFIHREAYYMPEGPDKDAKIREAEIITAKFRNGQCGPSRATWLGEYGIFENATATIEEHDFT